MLDIFQCVNSCSLLCLVPSGFLLFSLSEGIMKTSIDTFRTKHKLPLSNAGSALYQDIYFQTGRIFWLNNTHQTINAAFLNGSDMKVIVKGGLENANGLAVDWMAGNIYWLSQGRIEVAKLDGSFRKVLAYGKDMVAPAYIAVNPHIRCVWKQLDITLAIINFGKELKICNMQTLE